jgi:uncharacterized protein (DUF488 family)
MLTFGHGTATSDEIVTVLTDADVGLVVDVRRFPGSRKHPHVKSEALAEWLPAAGVAYRWEERLGGRRRVDPDSSGTDAWWRVEAFRAYAAHTRTDEFRSGLASLLADADPHGEVAIMCSETLWWRCHRRLISDVLVLLHDVPVSHLDHAGRLTPHVPSEGARVTEGGLVYDG